MNANYTRLFADESGESHFEDVEVPLAQTNFAINSPPLLLSEFVNALRVAFLGGSSGWNADWHPSSARNLFFVISGAWEIEASDGEVRTFSAPDVLLCEDLSGKGHRSRVVGGEDSLAAVMELPDTAKFFKDRTS